MDACNRDDLKAIEQRLAQWRPTSGGLDADAMLYQAGLEAGRHHPSRSVWPALCVALVMACAGLGAWGLAERAEHQVISHQLNEQRFAKSNNASEPAASYIPVSNDYLQLRRQVEQDPGMYLATAQSTKGQVPQTSDTSEILRAGQLNRLRDQ